MRLVKRLWWISVPLLIAVQANASDLQKTLEELAASHRGNVALYAKNLNTGETVSLNSARPVQTASVIKLPLMLQVFEQVRSGRLNLSAPLVLTKDNQVPGSGVLNLMNPGLTLSLNDVVTLMMVLSDNTATNMVIDAATLSPTNEMLVRMGLKNTYFYKKVYKKPEGPMPADQKEFGLGKTTAEEMARIMESIYRCDLGDRDLCRRMITIMRNQQYRDMLPRYLERGDTSEELSAIADKIGALDDVRNDVALVYTKRGPIIISIFTYHNVDQSWAPENKAEILIGRLARIIVDAWSPEGLALKVAEPLGMAATK
jgi:beta-lactamase class A